MELSPRALCELDDVKVYADIELEEQSKDDLFIRQINSASTEFHRVCRREIVAINAARDPDGIVTTPSQTRIYDARELELNEHGEYELVIHDLATLTSVTLDGVAVAGADVVALPRVRQEWQPIERLRFSTLSPKYTSLVAVTGVWGFPQIPEDVRDKVIKTVTMWANRDLERFSDVFVSAEGQIVTQRSLPSEAYTLAIGLRRHRGLVSIRVGRAR